MKTTYRIVTKTRYGMLRISLLFVAFTIEYWLCLNQNFLCQLLAGDISGELLRFIFGYMGYILLHVLFVFRSHSQKVYLRYEFILSLLIKCVVIDGIAFLFYAATGFYTNLTRLAFRFAIMTGGNLITILAVMVIINLYTKYKVKKPERILYVRAEDEISEKKLEDYDAVYLYDIPAQQRNDWLKLCYEKNMTVYTTAKLSDILIRTSGIAQDKDCPVFYCTKFGIGTATAVLKRSMDLFLCVIALLVLWPVMLVTAICIKLEDGGSVFYSQTRCTKDLKEFQIFKFRSMQVGSEDETGARLSNENDVRVTKVGRFIRKWKIDELPQLFNILKGDMSIVGPRPERPELIEKYSKLVPEFVLRTKVKAGLTGYAQVRGKYETDMLDKLKWDLIYIENYSILLDVKIIIITAIMLFKRKL